MSFIPKNERSSVKPTLINNVVSKGLTPNVAKDLQTLIFKIDGLIDSFPQNKPESGVDLFEEDNDEDDEVVEEFEEEGDFI